MNNTQTEEAKWARGKTTKSERLALIWEDMKAMSDSRVDAKTIRAILISVESSLRFERKKGCSATTNNLLTGAIGLIEYMVVPIGAGVNTSLCYSVIALIEVAIKVERSIEFQVESAKQALSARRHIGLVAATA